MLRQLILLLVNGRCLSCGTLEAFYKAEIAALRQQVSALQDRLMSRDFGQYKMAQVEAKQVETQTELMAENVRNGKVFYSPDGLD